MFKYAFQDLFKCLLKPFVIIISADMRHSLFGEIQKLVGGLLLKILYYNIWFHLSENWILAIIIRWIIFSANTNKILLILARIKSNRNENCGETPALHEVTSTDAQSGLKGTGPQVGL